MGDLGKRKNSVAEMLHLTVPTADHLYRITNATMNQSSMSRSRNRVNSPRPRSASIAPPIFPLKDVQDLTDRDRRFLEAAERGDKPTLDSLLNQGGINVNASDVIGRTAIEIAVDNENTEIVELLLRQREIKIGNALLYAIREGVYRILEMILNHRSISAGMLGDGWAKSLDYQDSLNSEYSSDISPVMLAAHLNQFEILGLLIKRGARIHKPHTLSCTCAPCQEERETDSLHHSLRRIHAYRALASPAWLCLTSSDPILDAFKLSWELQNLSNKEFEFKEVFLELSEQCKTFACDLQSQCRSSEEVIAVLNKDSYSDPEQPDPERGKLSLARLKLAIKYEQKRFVAHPHCQQLLTSIWYEGFPGRQERGSFVNIIVCMALILMWPFMAIWYIILPKSRIGQIVRSPFMKFLYYSTSFGCFLLLLTMASFEAYKFETDGERVESRAPLPSLVEWLIIVWVVGMVWSEIKQLWEEGLKKYILQWWNWLDYIMLSLYLCTFIIRATAYYMKVSDIYTIQPVQLARSKWDATEPILISEALFAVANIFSFSRIVYLFQTNPYLGPLQISLGCMLIDIAKFFFIFCLILSSFAIGLHQLYWYYSPSENCSSDNNSECYNMPFTTLSSSYVTLIWSLFSITTTKDTEVSEDHTFTEYIGRGMFVAYHVCSIIVLLNMLIAMMSHSFQIINDHADLEWKFHRSKLWMSHFDEGSSLPAPFNLIISPKSVFYFLNRAAQFVRWVCCKNRPKTAVHGRQKRATIRLCEQNGIMLLFPAFMLNESAPRIARPGYNRDKWQRKRSPSISDIPPEFRVEKPTYQQIIYRLVSRYIHMTKKEMKMDGVNEDDLLEIKQDISSLRYELREDRRREIVRSSSHIDGVKRDIIRTISVRTPAVCVTSPNNAKNIVLEESNDGSSPPITPLASEEPASPTNFFYSDANSPQSERRQSFETTLVHRPSIMSLPPGIMARRTGPTSPELARKMFQERRSASPRDPTVDNTDDTEKKKSLKKQNQVRFTYPSNNAMTSSVDSQTSTSTPIDTESASKLGAHSKCNCIELVDLLKQELKDNLKNELVEEIRVQFKTLISEALAAHLQLQVPTFSGWTSANTSRPTSPIEVSSQASSNGSSSLNRAANHPAQRRKFSSPGRPAQATTQKSDEIPLLGGDNNLYETKVFTQF